jgi:hypothetical protein
MKTPTVKLMVVTGLIALASALVIAPVRAADAKEDAAERKARREAEILKKYDADHDGKLGAEEKAARKADREKAKAEREAKKHERAAHEGDADPK